MSITLTLKLGKILPTEPLELDAGLNQKRVVIHHLFEVILDERVLNVITAIVDTSGAHVAACAL